MAKTYQQFETLRLVVYEALGGSKQNGGVSSAAKPVETFAELAAAFQELGGVVG